MHIGAVHRFLRLLAVPVTAVLLLAYQPGNVFALNANNIIAYPVPFNPRIQTMKIGFTSGTAETVDRVKIEIFDINGDVVLEREYSSLAPAVIWNGRNGSGRMVGAGMYIIKVTVEKSDTGEHGVKIIRILVNR
ncbi:MAG TPA: FlgD immunoglobulin-like domain containing protein [Spirochaetota bacterium]|nr:FlgD immunoglobulin-like domain containing protein [Spirochaetota bacterium]